MHSDLVLGEPLCNGRERVNNFHPSTSARAIRTGRSTGEALRGWFVNPPRDFCQADGEVTTGSM